MVQKWIMIILAFLPVTSESQGLFEATNEPGSASGKGILFNGFIRSDLYLGNHTARLGSNIRSGYGEASFKIEYSALERVRFYSEVRIRGGFEYNNWIVIPRLREAYADLSLGSFDLRMGQQVIAWGRADGINPTHNLVPRDYFVRSPETDDLNMGNMMLSGRFSPTEKFRLEAVWVPVYRNSVFRFDLFDLPEYEEIQEGKRPDANLGNGTFAIRAEWFFNGFDGSVSWFHGYDPMPGIEPASLPDAPVTDFTLLMHTRAFRQQTLGLDFSSGMGSFGVRGEAAFRIPDRDFKGKIFSPQSDIRYVLGIDRTMGNLSILAMYSGQFVPGYTETEGLSGMAEIDPLQFQDPAVWSLLVPLIDRQMEEFNRKLFNQTREITHAVAMRPAFSMLHGVVETEIFSLYNFSTDEWNIHPSITWRISDELKLIVGGQYFHGPENTIYELIAPVFNGGLMEIRYSF